MYAAVVLLCSACFSTAISPSLFRSAEFLSEDTDWVVEEVQVIPIDDGQWHINGGDQRSYLVYRTNASTHSSSFILDLQLNTNVHSRVPIEYDHSEVEQEPSNSSFYSGSVRHWEQGHSIVGISIGPGLSGLIHHTPSGIDYILEPLVNADEQSHILAHRKAGSSNHSLLWSCDVNASTSDDRNARPRRARRSVIRERFIETLLVADASVTEFFSHPHVTELYLMTMMNMVNSIYGHVSLGYPVEIVLSRIIMLSNQSDFQMASQSHETLHDFCAWQEQLKKSNKNNTRAVHHDVGVFLTRKSLCRENATCSTIGLAHMAGMCVVNRSCNINQDIGLISAYTIAHEIGHNLGMNHDGDKGHCASNADSSQGDTIMVPSYAKVPTSMWSRCSRDNLTDFFDQGWGKCLNNRPAIIPPHDDQLPGIIFDLDEQCRLAIGPRSTSCFLGDEPPFDICTQMLCTKLHQGRPICVSTLTNQPADGTLCGPNKWCLHGTCTPMSYRSETPSIHGGWSPWTPWSSCSHTCGLGVGFQHRTCTHPKPAFGGKQCLGVRKRYRTCTAAPCKKSATNHPHETHLNCDELNSKSNGTRWKTVSWFAPVPCMVFCTPASPMLPTNNATFTGSNVTFNGDEVGKIESIKFRDGTQCTIDDETTDNRLQFDGMCIAGQCQKLGCDHQLYSTAVQDECGVCNGNRSHCQRVTKELQYKKQDTTPVDSYVKIGSLAKGISTFHIEKITQPSSFLAIKVKDRYYLNGNRSITESSLFLIGQTRLWYRRALKQEILEGYGQPLSNEIDIMMLVLNTDLIKIKCTYWEPMNGTKVHSNHYAWTWDNETNTDCACTTKHAQCTFKSHQNERLVVSDQLCDAKLKPRAMPCQSNSCSVLSPSAPRWQVGPWRACEGRCWPQEAVQRRSLLCVRTVSNNRTHVIPTMVCLHWLVSIPITVQECPQNTSSAIPKCSSLKTYSRWNTSEWTGNCTSAEPCALQYRKVTCVTHDANALCHADEKLRPADQRPCNATCGQWLVAHWTDTCTGSCANATVTRRVWCSSTICNHRQRPPPTRRCFLPQCANASIYKTIEMTSPRTTKMTTSAAKNPGRTLANTKISRAAATSTPIRSSSTPKTTTASPKKTSKTSAATKMIVTTKKVAVTTRQSKLPLTTPRRPG